MRILNTVGITFLMVFMLMGGVAYGTEEALSLDEIIANERQKMESTEAISNTEAANTQGGNLIPSSGVEKNIVESSNDMMSKLGDAAVLDTSNEKAEKAAGKLKTIVNIVVTILCYIITLGLTIRVTLDLMYIGLPFSRKFLANGYAGNARAGDVNAASPMGGMGLGSSPYFGFGGGGLGTGRFGGFGGFGSRFGGGMRVDQNSAGAYQDQMGTMTGRLQIVSNAALNAAASETTIDPDGRNASPFKIYAQDMMLTLIITPVLLILAVSGALFHVGLVIGGALATILSGVSNMI